jgi:hypothetical protein
VSQLPESALKIAKVTGLAVRQTAQKASHKSMWLCIARAGKAGVELGARQGAAADVKELTIGGGQMGVFYLAFPSASG